MTRPHWTRGFGTEIGRAAGEAEADKLAALLIGMRTPDAHIRAELDALVAAFAKAVAEFKAEHFPAPDGPADSPSDRHGGTP